MEALKRSWARGGAERRSVRPFGASVLLGVMDEKGPSLYGIDAPGNVLKSARLSPSKAWVVRRVPASLGPNYVCERKHSGLSAV